LQNQIVDSEYQYLRVFDPEEYPKIELIKKTISNWLEDLKSKNLQLFSFECPVNIVITDQYGRVISNDINQIPNAEMFKIVDTMLFIIPSDLAYSVNIDAYGSGTFNFTRASPIGKDISITKFENIPVTSSTKASVEIEPNVTNYTMSIDYNGDGVSNYPHHNRF
jgi:hypothetical protein